MTTRGANEEHFIQISRFLHRFVYIAIEIQVNPKTKINDFVAIPTNPKIFQLKKQVHTFSIQFKIPGFSVERIEYSILKQVIMNSIRFYSNCIINGKLFGNAVKSIFLNIMSATFNKNL
jgi:hypothetical protein